jgi:protein ImuA
MLGTANVDRAVGTLARGTIHDVYAATSADAVAAHGFALGLALRASSSCVVWVMQNRASTEAGRLYGPGLRAWGLDPERLILATVRETRQLLAAGEEALASGAAGAVILSGWGEARDVTLTASRRLASAAHRSGSTGFFVRAAARPAPSAAQTRWSVAAAPSRPLEAGAPGRPAFHASLTRSRSGAEPGDWVLEWDREARAFVDPAASGGVVPVPAHRPAGAHAA